MIPDYCSGVHEASGIQRNEQQLSWLCKGKCFAITLKVSAALRSIMSGRKYSCPERFCGRKFNRMTNATAAASGNIRSVMGSLSEQVVMMNIYVVAKEPGFP